MMIKKLPLILLVLVALYVLFATNVGASLKAAVGMAEQEVADLEYPRLDGGMYDIPSDDAFGTTEEADRRITNDGVRKEFNREPFPWSECGDCAAQNCPKHGVPDPAPGQEHVCRSGFPSKRVIDSYGGHFQLNHICASGMDYGCGAGDPPALGRWWGRKACSCVQDIGLNIRPACSRCS